MGMRLNMRRKSLIMSLAYFPKCDVSGCLSWHRKYLIFLCAYALGIEIYDVCCYMALGIIPLKYLQISTSS